ncbi:MAG TPA: hypothetical protein ENH85_00255 [Candidatus Scalindua sp.]|nr:hypothetical protein [Candidatus Scalindua sp.]
MKARNSDICVICGKNPSIGRDHIPPQSIFPKPRPNDLITIPACDQCNNKRSGLDEKFKVFIGINAGHGSEGERLFRDQTTKTLEHNRKLRRQIASTMREVEVKTPVGLILGTTSAVLLDSNAYDTVIDRIIRGLHFHHTGHILGDNVYINVHWYRKLTKKIYEMTNGWPTGVVGCGQFIYKYVVFDEEPLGSVWVFQFFNRAWSGGTVLPKK